MTDTAFYSEYRARQAGSKKTWKRTMVESGPADPRKRECPWTCERPTNRALKRKTNRVIQATLGYIDGGGGLYARLCALVPYSTTSCYLPSNRSLHACPIIAYFCKPSRQAARDPFNETHSAQVLCEPGYFCKGGRKEPCPAGTFLWQYGESSRDSCAPCKVMPWARPIILERTVGVFAWS